jgi:Skp family chaperone for outer membrane proteins
MYKIGILTVLMISCWCYGSMAEPGAGSVSVPVKTPGHRIAILDTKYIMQEAKVAKQLSEELEKRRSTYENEALKAEEELRQLHKQLQEDAKVGAAEDLTQRQYDFERKVMGFRKLVQAQKTQLAYIEHQVTSEIEKRLHHIIEGLSQSQEIDIVFPAAVVVYGKPEYDITVAILKELDHQMPFIDIERIVKDYMNEVPK